MGRKEKRAEKAKVKLKGHTTQFLPKGLNVTKTAFKVRKIVLQQQIKTHDGDQPLSKRKLNIKEVLARLQHYSSSQRLEGLVGLTDVISQMNMEQLLSHLSSIIDSLGRMSLDDESKVRKQSAHILTSVFSLVNETQLLPFSATLGSYLSCAMTHIKLGIQEDSLLLLDALLEKAPALAATSVHQLLPCVLDMISRSRSNHATRQLSIQLSSNLVSSIWRAKVFGRLQALLVASISHRKEPGTQHTITLNRAYHTASTLTLTVDPRKQFHFPIYNKINAVPVSLNKIFHKSSVTTKQLLDNVTQLRGFVESIMPLMLDSWMEVNPISSKKSNQKTEDHGLQMETALILHCVLEIIELLWQHIILWDKNNSQHELTDWFTATFANDVNRFLGKGFPYSARVSFSIDDLENESQGEGRKSNKKNQETSAELSLFHLASPSLLKDKDELSCTEGIAKCVLQNLTLSHLLLNINKSPPKEVQEKILDTLTEYLNQWGGSLLAWSDHLFRTIRSVFYSGIAWEVDLSPFLLAVVSRYNRSASKKQASHQKFASKLCDLLVELSLHENFQHLLGFESFTSWFSQLAHSLSNGNVTIDKLCVLNQLACHNNAAFLQGFQTAFTSLLDAVKNFHLAEGENKSVKEAGLASLFFWVSDWNDEQIEALKTVLVSENCSPSLALKIVNILLLRSEKFAVLAGASSWLVG